MQQQTVHDLQRALLKVLMRPVHGVPGLKTDDPAPPPFAEGRSCLGRGEAVALEGGVLGQMEDSHGPRHKEVPGRVQCLDAGMSGVGGLENRASL
jgi:hypothetical protein